MGLGHDSAQQPEEATLGRLPVGGVISVDSEEQTRGLWGKWRDGAEGGQVRRKIASGFLISARRLQLLAGDLRALPPEPLCWEDSLFLTLPQTSLKRNLHSPLKLTDRSFL